MEKEGRELDYLGYCFMRGNVRMRKSIKKNFARKAHRLKSEKRRREVLSSYKGWCKWGNCRHLWKTITGTEMSFAEKGIAGRNQTKDGKRFFDIRQVKIMDILNVPIQVIDFEPGVNTCQGPERYAVKVIFEEKPVKFITNSITLKSQLDQAKAMNALPIDTKLKKRDTGGNVRDYIFE